MWGPKPRPLPGPAPGRLTMCLWRSASVFSLYQGSSLLGAACHTYLSSVLIRALLMRMHR